MKLWENIRGLAVMSALAVAAAMIFCGCDQASEKIAESEAMASEAAASDTSGNETSGTDNTTAGDSAGSNSTDTQEEETGLTFPYELEDGKLTVNSLFTSDIMNPDCNNEDAVGIASIEITNQSDEALTQGVITVTTTDGTIIPFTVACLPAGETAWVFASDNTTLENTETPCEKIEDDVTFTDEDMLMTETFEISAEDTTVTLNNISGKDLSNITVYCHGTMDGTIYGGITYTYTVDQLSAGETAAIDAEDCWLGTAEVVYVTAEE